MSSTSDQQTSLDTNALIRNIVEHTHAVVGSEYFRLLVKHLSEALGVSGVWVTEYYPEELKLKSLAFWLNGKYVEHYEYSIVNTPCERVVDSKECFLVSDKVIELFPDDPDLPASNAVSYMGLPLLNTDNVVAGHGGISTGVIQDFYGGGKEDDSRKEPFVLDNSEPPILLGNNEGANPVEYILHGLAGCMTTTMVLHAAANNIPLESVESVLEGDMDVQGFLGLNDKVRNGYQHIRVTFNIKGDLTDEQKKKLESFVRMSPVFDIVTNKVPVMVKLQY
jgi:uncharacterized OsmC-like protein